MKREPRLLVWEAYKRTKDAPYRRKGDRRWGFRCVHASGGRQMSWPIVLGLIGRRAVAVEHFYARHFRERLVQVFLGPRAVLRKRFSK